MKGKPVLSDRQKQVLSLIDERLTIKEMAGQLQISETRVNQHIDMLKRVIHGKGSTVATAVLDAWTTCLLALRTEYGEDLFRLPEETVRRVSS